MRIIGEEKFKKSDPQWLRYLQKRAEPLPPESIVLLPEESVYPETKWYLKSSDLPPASLYFFYAGCFWGMADRKDILKLQETMRMNKDYSCAKSFNEYLQIVSVSGKSNEWLFYPREIQIEHTNRCNGRCIMCPHTHIDKSVCRDMDESVFRRIERFLPFCRYVGLHGFGEPFLAKNIEACMERYRSYGIRLYTNTNLNYLPEMFIHYISDFFDELNISCDGDDEMSYSLIRKGLNFNVLVENIRRIRKNCPHVRLNLFVVAMRQNMGRLERIVRLAAKEGFESVHISNLVASDINMMDAPELHLKQYLLELRKAEDAAIEEGLGFFAPIIPASIDVDKKNDNSDMHKENPKSRTTILSKFQREQINEENVRTRRHRCKGLCDVLHKQMYCDIDGQIAVCCIDNHHYIVNICELSHPEQYWQSEGMLLLRSSFEEGYLPGVCEKCNYIALNALPNLSLTDKDKYMSLFNHC